MKLTLTPLGDKIGIKDNKITKQIITCFEIFPLFRSAKTEISRFSIFKPLNAIVFRTCIAYL